jgi:hypothetical protein
MGGFDRALADAAFFPDGHCRSIRLVNLGPPSAMSWATASASHDRCEPPARRVIFGTSPARPD